MRWSCLQSCLEPLWNILELSSFFFFMGGPLISSYSLVFSIDKCPDQKFLLCVFKNLLDLCPFQGHANQLSHPKLGISWPCHRQTGWRRWEKPGVYMQSINLNSSLKYVLTDLGFGKSTQTTSEFKLSLEVSSCQVKNVNYWLVRTFFCLFSDAYQNNNSVYIKS